MREPAAVVHYDAPADVAPEVVAAALGEALDEVLAERDRARPEDRRP